MRKGDGTIEGVAFEIGAGRTGAKIRIDEAVHHRVGFDPPVVHADIPIPPLIESDLAHLNAHDPRRAATDKITRSAGAEIIDRISGNGLSIEGEIPYVFARERNLKGLKMIVVQPRGAR
jgi:hypothetical protein